ncbi:MAG: sensor histidine kinase [Cyanophyceae cyanobacterium]
MDEFILEIETIDNDFAEQAKDRKNLFLRGHKPKDLDKYLGEINEVTQVIQQSTRLALDHPLSEDYKEDLEAFLKNHSDLMTVYLQGVEVFKQTQDYRQGDQFVRGEGKNVGEILDQVLEQLKTDRQKLFVQNQRDIQGFLFTSTAVLIVIIVVASVVLSIAIAGPIRRVVRFTSFLEADHEIRQRDASGGQLSQGETTSLTAYSFAHNTSSDKGFDEVGYMIDAHQRLANSLQESRLQLVQSEKMSALGGLVAGVAHEINNPVGCIVGNVEASQVYVDDLLELLECYDKQFPEPGPAIEERLDDVDLDYIRKDFPTLLRAMRDSGDRITAISRSLRTFSRADTATKQKFDIHEGIDSTVLILRHRLKANNQRPAIKVIKDYGDIPELACFPGQLNQVFMNVLANAIDAFDEVSQDRSFAENPYQITIHTSADDSQVSINIADNGSGIPDDIKGKIFDQLFTTKAAEKGTGLGLAIARRIITETHGGILEVDSKVGQGTQFQIVLPID